MPEANKEDNKEIRLFGEKSIKEEAYRQKIIQLEKELMKMEALIESQREKKAPLEEDNKLPSLPEYSEGIFYEAAASLDERVKKYQQTLETKARDIGERLNLMAQNLINQEKIHTHIITTRWALIILSLFTIITAVLCTFCIFAVLRPNATDYQKNLSSYALYEKPQQIRKLLQESGYYKNQYTIMSLNYYDYVYKGTVELHFNPYSKWDFKMIASDIIENFKKISPGKSIELNFIYEGNAYAKVDFSSALDQTHYEFIK